jgi:hypothetical protein
MLCSLSIVIQIAGRADYFPHDGDFNLFSGPLLGPH